MTNKFANHIDVYTDLQGEFRFTIDGGDFPWQIESLAVEPIGPDSLPTLRITIPARRITFEQTTMKDNA